MNSLPGTAEASQNSPFPGVWVESVGQGGHDSGYELNIEPDAAQNIPGVVAAAEHYAKEKGGVGFDLTVQGRKERIFAVFLGGTVRFSLLRVRDEEVDEARVQEVAQTLGRTIAPPAPRGPQQVPLFHQSLAEVLGVQKS